MTSSFRGPTLGLPKGTSRPTPSLCMLLRDARKELKSIDEKREALQNQIKATWAAISEAQSAYWAQESTAFDEHVRRSGGEKSFTDWRSKFARKEARRAQDVAKRQRQLRSQIGRSEQELSVLDAQYWQKWTACLEAMSDAPSKKTPSREAKSSNPSGPSGIRKVRDRAAAASPRQAKSKASLQRALAHASTSLAKVSPTITPTSQKQSRTASPAQAPKSLGASLPLSTSNPVPGQVYQAYYDDKSSSEKGWYFGTPLPWDGDEWKNEIKLDFSMRQMDLKEGFPDCYIAKTLSYDSEDSDGANVSVETITGIKDWAPGFEDGGPREKERRVLFLFFDDRNKRPGKLNIPKRTASTIKFSKADLKTLPIDWVSTKDLRPAEVNDETMIRGRATAGKFKRFMDKVRAIGDSRPDCHTATEEFENGIDGVDNTIMSIDVSPTARASETTDDITTIYNDDNQQPGTTVAPYNYKHYEEPQYNQAPQKSTPVKNLDSAVSTREDIVGIVHCGAEEFDEGLGMDYDLDFKSKFRLFPAASSQGDAYQATKQEAATAEPSGTTQHPASSQSLLATGPKSPRLAYGQQGWQSPESLENPDDDGNKDCHIQ